MQCGMRANEIKSSQSRVSGLCRALLSTARGIDRHTGCKGSTLEYARQLKRDLEQGHDFNKFEISFGGYSSFPRQLDHRTKIVLSGDMLYRIPQDTLLEIIRFLPGAEDNISQKIHAEGVIVATAQSEVLIQPFLFLPAAEDVRSLKSWHSNEIGSMAAMVTSYPSVIGDGTTLAGMISKLKIETLMRACSISQKALESQNEGIDGGFSLVTGGSLNYGPRLRSDIDFLVVHDGSSTVFSRFCDEIRHTLLDLGIESHNLVSVGGTGVDSISLPDLRAGRINFGKLDILTKSRPFLRAVEGIGSPGLFNDFISSRSFNKAGLGLFERAWFWNKLGKLAKAINKTDGTQNLEEMSAGAVKAFKLFIQFAKAEFGLQEIALPEMLSEMKQKGSVSDAEYNDICSFAEFVWKLDNVVFCAGQRGGAVQNEEVAACMGFKDAEELVKEISIRCGNFSSYIARFIKAFGGSEITIRTKTRAAEALWSIQDAFSRIGEYFDNGNAVVYLRRSKVRSDV